MPVVFDSIVPLMVTPAVFSAPLTRLSAVMLARLTLGVAAVKRQPLSAQVLLLAIPAQALPAASSKLPGLISTWYCLPAISAVAGVSVNVVPPWVSMLLFSVMLLRVPSVSLTSTTVAPEGLITTASLKLSTRSLPGSTVVALPGNSWATGPWVSMLSVGTAPATPLLPTESV